MIFKYWQSAVNNITGHRFGLFAEYRIKPSQFHNGKACIHVFKKQVQQNFNNETTSGPEESLCSPFLLSLYKPISGSLPDWVSD